MHFGLLSAQGSEQLILRDLEGNYFYSSNIRNLEEYISLSSHKDENFLNNSFSVEVSSNKNNTAIPNANIPIWGTGLNFHSHIKNDKLDFCQSKLVKSSRPLLFYKGNLNDIIDAPNTVNSCQGEEIAVEAEVAILINSSKKIIGYTLAYDVTRYSLELINPMYLDQAKNFDNSFIVGPIWHLINDRDIYNLNVTIELRSKNNLVTNNNYNLSNYYKDVHAIIESLFEFRKFPRGVILMLGSDGFLKIKINSPEFFSLSAFDNRGLVLEANFINLL